MNKIISVNIGGLVFPIDETAFDKLEAYFKALRSQFEGTEGSDEIVHDIELRIAEIFQERRRGENGAILATDIDYMVETMGKPEDYDTEESSSASGPATSSGEPGESDSAGSASESEATGASGSAGSGSAHGSSSTGNTAGESAETGGTGPKRFFRNPDDKVLGGVCSGFAAYLNVDPLIVRVVFVVLVFSGLSIIFYPIFWLIIPEAKTRADKMQMRGEKINISTIEKSIRAEFDDLKQRFDNLTGSKKKVGDTSEPIRHFGKSLGELIGKAFSFAFSLLVLVIVIRVLLAVFGGLFSSIIGGYHFGIMGLPDISNFLFSNSVQKVLVLIGAALLIAIPAIVFLYKMLRYFFGVKRKNRVADGLFTLFWLAGLGMVITAGVQIGREFGEEASFKEHVPITTTASTLYVDLLKHKPNQAVHWRGSDRYIHLNDNSAYIQDDSLFIENVELEIVTASGKNYNLYTVLRSRGKDRNNAKRNAREIEFNIKQRDSIISLPARYSTGKRTWRNQRMGLILEIPVGYKIIIDEKVDHILKHVDRATFIADRDFFNTPLIMSAEGLQPLENRYQLDVDTSLDTNSQK